MRAQELVIQRTILEGEPQARVALLGGQTSPFEAGLLRRETAAHSLQPARGCRRCHRPPEQAGSAEAAQAGHPPSQGRAARRARGVARHVCAGGKKEPPVLTRDPARAATAERAPLSLRAPQQQRKMVWNAPGFCSRGRAGCRIRVAGLLLCGQHVMAIQDV